MKRIIERIRNNFIVGFKKIVNEEIVYKEDAARSIREMAYVFYAMAFLHLIGAVLIVQSLRPESDLSALAKFFIFSAVLIIIGFLLNRYKTRILPIILCVYCIGALFFSRSYQEMAAYFFFSLVFIYIAHLTFQYHKLKEGGGSFNLDRNKKRRSFAIILLAIYILFAQSTTASVVVLISPFAMRDLSKYSYLSSLERLEKTKEHIEKQSSEGADPELIQKAMVIFHEMEDFIQVFYEKNIRQTPFLLIFSFIFGVFLITLFVFLFFNILFLKKTTFLLFYCASLMLLFSFILFYFSQDNFRMIDFLSRKGLDLVSIFENNNKIVRFSVLSMFQTAMRWMLSLYALRAILIPFYLLTRPEIRARFK